MKKIMLMVALVGTTGEMFAQEAGAAGVEQGSLSAAAEAANADGGQAIADQATAMGDKLAATSPSNEFVTAEDQVNTDLEKIGLSVGYDSEKKAIIQVGSFTMKIENPSTDAGFDVKREQVANVAYLNAKAEVVRAINADFSAVDRVCTHLDETVDKNAEKVAAVKNAVEAKRKELAEALREYSEADAKTITDVTINDRYNAFLDAVIKKIDTDYSPEAIATKKRMDAAAAKAAADAIKAKVQALSAEYKALEEAAEKLPKDPATESSSAVQLMAKMPLLGACVLTQAESWNEDTKDYSVAMAIVWSPKLQESAVRIATGDFSSPGKPGKFSRAAWVKAQNWGSMVGSRRFTDDKGHNIFVGISSTQLTGPTATLQGKKKMAETMAWKNVAMALMGDVETYREASQNMKVYKDDSTATSQKLSDTIGAKVNINLKGCMQLTKKTVKHPNTGNKMYVVAYYIDPALAKDAGEVLKKAYADAVIVTKHTQRERGKHAGMQGVLGSVRKSPTEFDKGRVEGSTAVTTPVREQPAGATGSGHRDDKPVKPVGGTHGDDPKNIDLLY